VTNLATRLRWLIAGQCALVLLEIPAALVPPFNDAPWAWALIGASIEPAMLLGFWCAFGRSSLRWKLGVLFAGAVYLAAAGVSHYAVGRWTVRRPLGSYFSELEYLRDFGETLVRGAFFLAGLTCTLWAMRFGLRDIRLAKVASDARPLSAMQFSIKQLLAVTLLAAIFLCLARAYRYPWPEGLYDGRDLIGSVLLISALSMNTLLASWAELSDGPVGMRTCFALVLALPTGLAYCAASMIDPMTIVPWLIYTLLLVELPTAILVGSLLVVRSCGYRLVPNRRP